MGSYLHQHTDAPQQRRGLRTASTQRYEAHHLSSPPAIFFLPLLYFWLSSILFLFFIYFQFCPLLSFVLDRFNNYVSLSALMDKELDAWSPKHYDEVFNFSLCVLFFSFPSPLLLFLSSASSSSLLLIFFVLCSSSSPLLLLFFSFSRTNSLITTNLMSSKYGTIEF